MSVSTSGASLSGYSFSNDWFGVSAKPVWDQLIPMIKPRKILEIGSYEGRSTCYLIDLLTEEFPVEIHCVDSWEGGAEHKEAGADMISVETRFRENLKRSINSAANKVELIVHKGLSDVCLPKILSSGKSGYFDFVYVDGSHQAPDVLFDAVVGFKLLRIGGVMAFDDYTWAEDLIGGKDLLRMPKPAIDAFVNLHIRKLNLISAPLSQLYVQKLAE
jgi:predicted O-methyltransferase YrrM